MKTHAIIFTLGLLLGLFFSFMYRTLLIDFPKPLGTKQSIVELKKEAAATDKVYSKSFDSLVKRSVKLEGELQNTRKALSKAKAQSASLKSQVTNLIIRKKVEGEELPISESACDSLVTTVEFLILSNAEKDSLYEVVNTNLTEQIANKDSTIDLKGKQYNDLKSTLDKSYTNQLLLSEENKLLTKQVKKQKFKSKVLSAALFIFSGIAINQLIRR